MPGLSSPSGLDRVILTGKTVFDRSSRVCTFFGVNSARSATRVIVPSNRRAGKGSTQTAAGWPTATRPMAGSGT